MKVDVTQSTKRFKSKIFNEDAITYTLYKFCVGRGSQVFFQIKHNFTTSGERHWTYWCAPDVDVLEIVKDGTIIAYELKGARKYKGENGWPGYYDGIGQALAYLHLPVVWEDGRSNFNGGAFDYVYLVHARPELRFDDIEQRVLNLLPAVGFGVVLPSGKFSVVKEAEKNPIQDNNAKKHLLQNLHTLEKFSVRGKTFRRIEKAGEAYLGSHDA